MRRPPTSSNRSAAPAGTPLARLIGRRIATLRVERGWSQGDLAALAGIFPTRLDLYEKGLHEPPLRTLKRLARALGVRLDALVEEKRKPAQSSTVEIANELRLRGQESAAAVLDILVGLERLIHARQRRASPPSRRKPCTKRARRRS